MPGGIPLATCTLPVGMFYLLTYYYHRAQHARCARWAWVAQTLPLVGLCDIDGGVAISWDSAIS
jgi:hypothetical protein